MEPKDFLLKSMPELSSEGSERETIVKPREMEWKFDKDELNNGKTKCSLEFSIPRGSYATVLIEILERSNLNAQI